MSCKPIKKSDINKSWLTVRQDRKILIAPDCHLIVTEGTKTEPNYFQGLKADIEQRYKNRIFIDGKGRNTLSLLKAAEKIVEKSDTEYQHVWLVYDRDDFPKDDFDNTLNRCKALSDDNITYHALWSNECIELWFLLHFEFLQSALHRDSYYLKLSEYLNVKYKKNSTDIYVKLKQHLNTAINNAKKLMKLHDCDVPSKCNPATNVYEIFELLKVYIQ